MIVSGTANRTVRDSVSTSRDVRDEQVAGAGPLDRADRQRQRVVDELLTQLGEHLLAQSERAVPRAAGQQRLRDEEDRDHDDDLVDLRSGRAVLHVLHQVADQPRRRQPDTAASTCSSSAISRLRGCRRASRRACCANLGRSAQRAGSASSDGLLLFVWRVTVRRYAARSRAARGACRWRPPGRRRRRSPRRRGRAAAGWRSVRRCVRPARWSRSRSAIRASVCASTARGRLDQHQHVRVREQRARQHQPLALPTGERAAALLDLGVEPVRQCDQYVFGRRRTRARPSVRHRYGGRPGRARSAVRR